MPQNKQICIAATSKLMPKQFFYENPPNDYFLFITVVISKVISHITFQTLKTFCLKNVRLLQTSPYFAGTTFFVILGERLTCQVFTSTNNAWKDQILFIHISVTYFNPLISGGNKKVTYLIKPSAESCRLSMCDLFATTRY